MDVVSQRRAEQYQRSCGDPHLPFEGDGLPAPIYRQTALGPRQSPALDVHDVAEASGQKLFARLFASTARATDDLEGFFCSALASSHDGPRIEVREWHVACERAVNLTVLDGVRTSISSIGSPFYRLAAR